MADKAIYSVDTVTSVADTDKVYVNTGNNIKQVTKGNLVIDLKNDLNRLKYSETNGGENIWNEQWEVGRIDNTTGANSNSDTMIRSKDYIPVKASTNYYFATSSSGNLYRYRADKTFINYSSYNANSIVNTTSDTAYIRFICSSSYGTTYKNDIAIIEGTTGTYVPYIHSVKVLNDDVAELDSMIWGRQSINLWNEVWELGALSHTDGSNVASNISIRSVDYIEVKANTKYYFELGSYTSYAFVVFYDANKNFLSLTSNGVYGKNGTSKNYGNPFTTPTTCKYIKFHLYETTYNNDIAIIEGTSGSYVPYNMTNLMLTESAEKEEIAKYDLQLDGYVSPWINGVHNYIANNQRHKKIGRVDLGSLTWVYFTNTKRFYVNNASTLIGIKEPSSTTVPINAICSMYTAIAPQYIDDVTKDMSVSMRAINSQLSIRNLSYDNVADFTNAMKGVYLYYELATEVVESVLDNTILTDNLKIEQYQYYVGANQPYKTITSAYNKWVSDGKPKATIHIMNGVYEESINTGALVNNNRLYIVGETKRNTIWKMTNSLYANAPFICSGNVTVKNMSIIVDHDSTWTKKTGAYGIHIDNASGKGTVELEDLYVESSLNSAIGCGTSANQKLVFKNLELEHKASTEWVNNDGVNNGALLYHTSATANQEGQEIFFDDVNAHSLNGPAIQILSSANGNTDVKATFRNIIAHSDLYESYSSQTVKENRVTIQNNNGKIVITYDSANNNSTKLNYSS